MVNPQSRTAQLLAVEVLLADPESLGDDVLESCLYILRDRLRKDKQNTRDHDVDG
jgi:hypothetical protein